MLSFPTYYLHLNIKEKHIPGEKITQTRPSSVNSVAFLYWNIKLAIKDLLWQAEQVRQQLYSKQFKAQT